MRIAAGVLILAAFLLLASSFAFLAVFAAGYAVRSMWR